MSRYYRSILNVQGEAVLTPLTIAGCQLWLDAADASTISIGTGVSQWDNKGVLGGNFAQGTASAQPVYTMGGLNSKNILTFDGNDFLISSLSAASWNYLHKDKSTTFIVLKAGNSSNPNALYAVLSNVILTGSVGYGIAFDDRSSVSRNDILLHVNSAGNASVYNTTNVVNDSFLPNQFSKAQIIADPQNATAADRSKIITSEGTFTGNTATLSASTANASFTFRVGGFPDLAGFNLVGAIAEVISYDSILSGADITAINNYIFYKWAI